MTPVDLAEVVGRERLLLDPAVRAVPERVLDLLHPDFVEFGASGRVWHHEVADAVSRQPEAGGATDFVPVALAPGVVLLTYRVTGVRQSLRSSIWVADASGDWRLRFHQGTAIPPV